MHRIGAKHHDSNDNEVPPYNEKISVKKGTGSIKYKMIEKERNYTCCSITL